MLRLKIERFSVPGRQLSNAEFAVVTKWVTESTSTFKMELKRALTQV